jgi:dethiobiotin synthetase
LTINACKLKKIPILGVIFNQMPREPSIVESMTPNYVERLTETNTISIIPFMKKFNYGKVGTHLGKSSTIRKIISTLT